MRQALVLADFAALGFVLELFVVKEKLLAGCENKISPAVNAFESLVLEFHERPTSPYVPPAPFLMRKSASFKLPLVRPNAAPWSRAYCLTLNKCVTAMNCLCVPENKGKARFIHGLPRFLFLLFPGLFAAPFTSKGLLQAHLFARLQIKRMALDFFNDVFRLHLALEAA
jgi:hypothetical protein